MIADLDHTLKVHAQFCFSCKKGPRSAQACELRREIVAQLDTHKREIEREGGR